MYFGNSKWLIPGEGVWRNPLRASPQINTSRLIQTCVDTNALKRLAKFNRRDAASLPRDSLADGREEFPAALKPFCHRAH